MLLEFLPLAAFGGAYYLYDFYVATAALMIAMGGVLAVRVLLLGKRDRFFFISCLMVWAFGSLTLVLQDKSFLQWKPTIFAWLIAISLLVSEWIGKTNLIEKISTKVNPNFHLPKKVWRGLNFGWSFGFALKGALNLYFAFYQEESVWVMFKIGGQTALSFVYLLLTLIYLRQYLSLGADNEGHSNHNPS